MIQIRHVEISPDITEQIRLITRPTETGDYYIRVPETVRDEDGSAVSTGQYNHILALQNYDRRIEELRERAPILREQKTLACVFSPSEEPETIRVSVEPVENYQKLIEIYSENRNTDL